MNDFCHSIRDLARKHLSAPILVHSDVFQNRRLVAPARDRHTLLASHLAVLETVAARRPLWFPTFNYDFTRTRLYEPQVSPSQVGPLTEYARLQWASWRHGPPVFNFCGNGEQPYGIAEGGYVDPFDDSSMFAHLHQEGASILMYGAPFSSFTAIHYVERLAGGPLYRYDKIFSGHIRIRGRPDEKIHLKYHCRPLGKRLEYDWPRLFQDAERQGVLTFIRLEGATTIFLNMRDFLDYWLDLLKHDPLYLLDRESRNWVEPQLERLGRPFIITDFEKNGES